jgi:hypothetical protein
VKAFFKISLITIISLIVVVIAAVASIGIWLPADKLKTILVNEITSMTGRDAGIETLSYNILKGIELKGVTISENGRYKQRAFISDGEITLKYNPFALFGGNLVINNFKLVSPRIEVIKEDKTRYNFTDITEYMAGKKDGKVLKNSGSKPQDNRQNVKSQPFIRNIIITGVEISNGSLVYVDYSKAKPLSVKVEKFNFKLDDLVTGVIKPVSMKINCIAIYEKLKIPVSMKSAISVDLIKKEANIKILSLNALGTETSGTINIKAPADIKGELISSADMEKLSKYLPAETAAMLKDTVLGIIINNNLTFSYSPGELKFKNAASIDNGIITYNKKNVVKGLNGKVEINDIYSTSGAMKMILAGNEVTIKIKGRDIADFENGRIDMEIYSPKFALEYLFCIFPGKKEKNTVIASYKTEGSKNPGKSSKKKEISAPGIFVKLKADSVFYKDVVFGRTISSIRFHKGKLDSETAINVYQGNINMNAGADLNNESYNCEAVISKVNVHDFINDAVSLLPGKAQDKEKQTLLDDMKNKVYGNLAAKLYFSGDTFKDMAQTITGRGDFKVTGGKLTALKMGKELAEKTGADFAAKDIPFDVLSSDFDMAKGRVNIKNFKLYNGKNGGEGSMRLTAAGWASIERHLDFSVNMDVSPEIAKQIQNRLASSLSMKDAAYAYNKDGWLPFDFRVYGTVIDKKYEINQSRMIDNIKRNLDKKLQKEGTKLLEEKAKGLIKSLFGG